MAEAESVDETNFLYHDDPFKFDALDYGLYMRFLQLLPRKTAHVFGQTNKANFLKILQLFRIDLVLWKSMVRNRISFPMKREMPSVKVEFYEQDYFNSFIDKYSKYAPYFDFKVFNIQFTDFSGEDLDFEPLFVPKTYKYLFAHYPEVPVDIDYLKDFCLHPGVKFLYVCFNELELPTAMELLDYTLKATPDVAEHSFKIVQIKGPIRDVCSTPPVPAKVTRVRFCIPQIGLDKKYRRGKWKNVKSKK